MRAIEATDLEYLHKWANDPDTQEGIGELHFPSSVDFHATWYQNLKNEPDNQRYIVDVPDLGIIGTSSLMNIDWRNRHAWHGLILGEASARGRGYGVDAVMATMRFAFDELCMQRLDGAMIEYNKPSIALYCGPRLGWKEEGRKRDYYYRNGRFWDQIVVGITRQDYHELVEKTQYWQ